MKFCGLTIGGWLMARAAGIAARRLAGGDSDREFLEGKLATALFYATQVLPRVLTLEHVISRGSDAVVGTDAALI
jgi:acyl-CoA dehydrogenase